MEPTSKTCTYCQIDKPSSEFSKSKRAKDGLQHNCKSCQKARRKKGSCSVDGCTRALLARGFCTQHWNEWRSAATGDDLARRKFQALGDAIEGRTCESVNGCVLWTGNRSGYAPNEYGVLTFGGKRLIAHRVAYEIANGPIPDQTDIDHTCHVKLCVNPEHMRLATRKQNSENLTGSHSNSLTGARGVTYDADRNQYRARVKHNRQEIHVGRFATLEEATEAVSAARRELFSHSDMDNLH